MEHLAHGTCSESCPSPVMRTPEFHTGGFQGQHHTTQDHYVRGAIDPYWRRLLYGIPNGVHDIMLGT